MVEPIDPAEGGHFQILHVTPRTLAMNEFGFVETVNRFGEGVVVAVTDAADRRFDASFGQTISVANGQILPAAVRVTNQSSFLNGASIMQGLFQCIEHKVCLGRSRDPPASAAAGGLAGAAGTGAFQIAHKAIKLTKAAPLAKVGAGVYAGAAAQSQRKRSQICRMVQSFQKRD